MIEIKNLHKSFDGQPVLQGVNLSVPKGKVTVILGPSGSGKTVLMRHIIGLLRPDRGEVMVDGVDIHRLPSEKLNAFRRRFGMVFQNAALFDSMNVYENIAFPLMEHTNWSPQKIAEVVREKLTLLGLEGIEKKTPSELSGGMRKRVGLARAIALEPQIILYDEPTTGLDPIMAESVDLMILDMEEKLKITSVVISHDMHSAFRIADQVAMLFGGKIIECSSPKEFVKSSIPQVREFIKKGEWQS